MNKKRQEELASVFTQATIQIIKDLERRLEMIDLKIFFYRPSTHTVKNLGNYYEYIKKENGDIVKKTG